MVFWLNPVFKFTDATSQIMMNIVRMMQPFRKERFDIQVYFLCGTSWWNL